MDFGAIISAGAISALVSYLIIGLSLSLPLTLVATRIINKNFSVNFSYFICSFLIGALAAFTEPFIPGLSQFTFLMHSAVLMLFIGASTKDYFKGADIALTIIIVFAMLISFKVTPLHIFLIFYRYKSIIGKSIVIYNGAVVEFS